MPNQKIFSVAGGSVQANDGLYIHRGTDEELLELCRAGAFAYVLTPRQMGKSSLMERTAERLTEEGFTSIIIDLQEMGVSLTDEQWYFGLVTKVAEQTTLRTNAAEWWRKHAALGFGQRLTLFLREVLMAESGPEERVVIFVDEIDTTLSLKFSDDFFTAVRSIYSSRPGVPQFRRLSFVLIGVATPTDLISDSKRTPFNIGQRIDLADFTFEEALPLAAGLGLPEDEARPVLRWALGWTGGHPFLTQQLCEAIAAKKQAHWTEAEVDQVAAEIFFGEDFSKNSNLLFVRDMLTERAPDREAVLNTYCEVLRGKHPVADEGQSVPKTHLKLSGVVRAEDGVLRVRNRIYREVFDEEWIRKHTPPNWRRRLTRVAAALVATLLFLSVPVGGFALYQWRQASAALSEAVLQREVAQEQRDIARVALADAETQRRLAEASAAEAERQRARAELSRLDAEAAQGAAEKSEGQEKKAKTEAERQRDIARVALADAETQRRLAVENAAEAQKQSELATANATEAERQRQSAVAALADAQEQRQRAEVALADADTQRKLAVKAAELAEDERKKAVKAAAEADAARESAEQQKKVAEQSQLVLQSLSAQKEDKLLQHSVLLAREALRKEKFDSYSIEAYQALSQGLALLPRPLSEYDGQFSDVVLSADGKYLLSDLRAGSRAQRLQDGEMRPTVTASPDLTFNIAVRDAHNEVSSQQNFGVLYSIAFSPDKKFLATSDVLTRMGRDLSNSNRGLSANVTNTNANVTVVTNTNTAVNANAANRNRAANAGGGDNGNFPSLNGNRALNSNRSSVSPSKMTIWEWSEGQLKEVKSLPLGNRVDAFALGPDGKHLAVARQVSPSKAKADGPAAFRPALFFFGNTQQLPTTPLISVIDVTDNAAVPETLVGEGKLALTDSPVNVMAFSATGQLIAVAQDDGNWVVWARAGDHGYRPVSHGKHDAAITAVAISPDEKYLATAGSDNAVHVWELAGAQAAPADFRKTRFAAFFVGGVDADPFDADIREDDKTVAATRSIIKGHRDHINAVVFSPTGKYLATASDDGTARLWKNWEKGALVEVARMTHDGAVTSISFDGDGTSRKETRVVTASADGTARTWELPRGSEGISRVLFGTSSNGDWSRNGRFLSVVGPEGTRAWDMTTGEEIFSTVNSTGAAAPSSPSGTAVPKVSDDGRYLLMEHPSVKDGSPQSPRLIAWQLWDREENRWLWDKEFPYSFAAFSPNEKYLMFRMVGSRVIDIVDVRTGKEILPLSLQENESADFTPDGDHLAMLTRGGSIRILEVKGGRQIKSLSAGRGLNSFVSSPVTDKGGEGYIGAIGSDGLVRVWKALSPKDDLVNEIKTPDRAYSLKFSPDGKHFVIFSQEGIQTWEIGHSARPIATIATRDVTSLYLTFFDQTGQFISMNSESAIRVFNTLTGCEVARIPTPNGEFGFIAADGRHLVLVKADDEITWRLWRPEDLIADVCNHVTRNISPSEWRNQYMLKMDPPKTCKDFKDPKQDTQPDDQVKSCGLSEVLR